MKDRGLQFRDGFVKAVRDLLVGDCRLDRVRGHQIRTVHNVWLRFFVQIRNHGSDRDLDLLRRGLSDLDVVLLAHVVLDVAVEHVAGRGDAFLLDDAAERDDGNLGCSASDVHHHASFRLLDFEPDSEGCSHRFVDEENVTSAGVLGGVPDRPDLDFGAS